MNEQMNELMSELTKQVFIPIFVRDGFDTWKLLDACVQAEVKVIEYTLRRCDADRIIPQIKKHYPSLNVLAGSTLDDDTIIKDRKKYNPQLLTLDQLSPHVDGFVSMFEYSAATMKKFRDKKLLIPCAYTPNEAYNLTCNGAHIIKMLGDDLSLVRKTMSPPGHAFGKIFVTGGVTLEKIPEIIASGAICVGSGFDLLLKGRNADITSREIAEIIREYIATSQNAVKKNK